MNENNKKKHKKKGTWITNRKMKTHGIGPCTKKQIKLNGGVRPRRLLSWIPRVCIYLQQKNKN